MSEEPLTCGKCGTPLIIDAAHVFFKGGKKAYIKCSNPACNNHRRIAFDAVEHLKPKSEAVKSIEEIHKYVEEHGIKPEEQGVKSHSAADNVVSRLTSVNTQDSATPDKEIADHRQDKKETEPTKGGGIWGWAAAGVGSLIVIGVGILLGGKKE